MEYGDKKQFSIICRCDDPVYDFNENDKTLTEGRKGADETGYDADMDFYYWIDNVCVRVYFSLYGVDFEIRSVSPRKPATLYKINSVNELILGWFSDKRLDDISEAFYARIEKELGSRIFERLQEIS